MGNVLKYEIKKSRFMMLIVGIIIGCLEIAYLIGFFGFKFAQNEKLNDIFTSICTFHCPAHRCRLLFHACRSTIQCSAVQQ